MPIPNTMTKESIRAIIDSVEYDPLAGMGCYTKKDILIDRLLAHCRTTQGVAGSSAAPAPILTDVTHVEAKKEGESKPATELKTKAA
jgi:hypothetical protein